MEKKIIMFILVFLPAILFGQIKEINGLVVDLLKLNRINIEQLDTMVNHYCDYSFFEMNQKITDIEGDMLVIHAIVNILYTTSSGRNLSLFNFQKPYLEAKYNEFILYCSKFRDLLSDIECGDALNRFYGRLYFLYFDTDYLIRTHSRLYLQ